MTLLGGQGLARLARINHAAAQAAAERLATIPGVELLNAAWFNEFTLILPSDARTIVRELADRGVLGGVSLGRLYPDALELERGLLVTVTETTSDEDIEALAAALAQVLKGVPA
jgi:glycine dehydrogenase subunit 1